ncbi:hypothetical protein K5D14_20010, partial [Klebsiella pneumoniae]|uniref:hypothetical protein n=1 Tax=Klebsiella pneumoniae TaxID=573 RepID=UPI00355C27F1
MASGTELRLCRVAAAPYPAYNPKSPLAQGLLKLPVLAASTSLRRSRKAGAARMDAGWGPCFAGTLPRPDPKPAGISRRDRAAA